MQWTQTNTTCIFSNKSNWDLKNYYWSDQLTASSNTVTPCCLSDHHIISCQINIKPPKSAQCFVSSRLLHKCDTEALKGDLSNIPWQVAEGFDEIKGQVSFWEEVLDGQAPKHRFWVRVKSPPWIDDDLRNLMRHRDWLHRNVIKERLTEYLGHVQKSHKQHHQLTKESKNILLPSYMLFKHASNSIVETSLTTSYLGRTRTPLNWTHWKNG